MKKLFLLIAGLGFLAAITGCILGLTAKSLIAAERIKGSGNLVTRTVTVPAFDAVQVSRGIHAIIKNTDSNEVEVKADDNLLDKVTVQVEESTLKISIDKSVKELANHHVTVTVPHNARIGKIDANSAACVVCEAPLTTKNVELDASSAAKIEATVHADKCEAEASSAAKIAATITTTECAFDVSNAAKITGHVTTERCKIELSSASSLTLDGTAADCKAETNSAARLSADKFAVKNYDVDASSGSSARIRCTETLNASASSGASVRYAGDCRARIKTSSGGSIREN